MKRLAKRTLARACLALGGAWIMGACILGGTEAPPTIDGYFGDRRLVTAWTESGTEVGTHAGEGHAPVLLDSLYRVCREVLAADTTQVRMYFGLDRNYILSSCGFVPKGCMDDCYRGVKIDVLWN